MKTLALLLVLVLLASLAQAQVPIELPDNIVAIGPVKLHSVAEAATLTFGSQTVNGTKLGPAGVLVWSRVPFRYLPVYRGRAAADTVGYSRASCYVDSMEVDTGRQTGNTEFPCVAWVPGVVSVGATVASDTLFARAIYIKP